MPDEMFTPMDPRDFDDDWDEDEDEYICDQCGKEIFTACRCEVDDALASEDAQRE